MAERTPPRRLRDLRVRLRFDLGMAAKRSISLAAALALMLVFVAPTSAHWSTTAAVRTGVGTGRVALQVRGDLDLTVAACGTEDDACGEIARTSITLTNTGSLPIGSVMTMSGPADTCPVATIDLALLPERTSLYSGQLCDLIGAPVHLTAGLNPAAALEVEITVGALESDSQAATGSEYDAVLLFSSWQWNDSDGWSHDVGRPITIAWDAPESSLDVEDPPAGPPSPPPAADPDPDEMDDPAPDDEVDDQPEQTAPPANDTTQVGDDPETPEEAADPVSPPPADDPPLARISGTIRIHASESGNDASDRKAVDGLPVSLHNAQGLEVASTETNNLGTYVFNDVVPSTYLVRFVAPTGHTFVTAPPPEVPGVDTDVVAIVETATDDGTPQVWGWTSALDLATNEAAGETVDAVIVALPVEVPISETTDTEPPDAVPAFQIAGTVWFDDGDGVRIDPPESGDDVAEGSEEPGEPEARAPSVVVTLYGENDAVLDLTSTDDEGLYAFNDIPVGTYRIEFIAPIGFTFAIGTDAKNEDHDSDVNDVLTELENSGPPVFSGWTADVLVEQDVAIDAGLIEAPPWEAPPPDDAPVENATVAPTTPAVEPDDAPVENATVAPTTPAVEPDNGHAEEGQGGDE